MRMWVRIAVGSAFPVPPKPSGVPVGDSGVAGGGL
jgi:hypothetical protein